MRAARCPRGSTWRVSSTTIASAIFSTRSLTQPLLPIDVGREYLQVAVCSAAYEELIAGYNASSLQAVQAAGSALVQSVLDIDKLLSSQPGFTLGEWLALSRERGHTDEEKRLMEWNARSQVTSWTPYSPLDPLPVPCAVTVANGDECHGIDGCKCTGAGICDLADQSCALLSQTRRSSGVGSSASSTPSACACSRLTWNTPSVAAPR